jgi:DNA polymerase
VNYLFLDKETFYGDGYSLSLKDITTESYVRDERFKLHGMGIARLTGPAKWITGALLPKVIERIPWHETALVGHNLQFDGFILSHHFNVHPKLYIDTLALSRALLGANTHRHGLKYVAEKLCGMTKMDELSKAYNIRDLPPHIEAALADYTIGEPRWNEKKQLFEAGDVILTREIFKKMIPHFPKCELLAADWSIRAFTDPKIYLDTDLLGEYLEELRIRKQQVLEDAGLNTRELLMSNDKYGEALLNLGVVPPTKINAKGKVTYAFAKTDAEHKALLDHDNPDVQALVAARIEHKSTIEETRAVLYRAASLRGAWPVGYNFAGADVTQRTSGNKGGGGNPQNLRRGGTLRKCIYAPEGYELGVADLSQIEARITLWLGMQITGPDGEEAKALKVMEEGGDIYGWFGTKIYGYKITKKETPLERQVAKSAVLGLGFGMGHARFMDYCVTMGIKGVDEQFAKEVVALYRSTFVGVRKFWAQCNKALNTMLDGNVGLGLPFDTSNPVIRTGLDPLCQQPCLVRPNGLAIKYPELRKDAENKIEYTQGKMTTGLFGGKVCENIVQAIAADVMRAQLVKVNKHYPVVMVTHDEVVCLIPEEDADVKMWVETETGGYYKTISKGPFSQLARRIMTTPISYMPGLPLDIESDTAIRYGDAK